MRKEKEKKRKQKGEMRKENRVMNQQKNIFLLICQTNI